MKKTSKKIYLTIFRLLCLIMSFIFIVFIPTMPLEVNDNLERIYSIFSGEKTDYNGLIEIWNIDSFEGGIKSKSSFLNSVAASFQKKYKGVYVLVRNITETECENMLLQGQKPDLFSCSYGVSLKIQDYLQPFSITNKNVYDNLLNAGKGADGQIYGLSWCLGLYYLISTKSFLSNAGVVYDENFSLIEKVFSLGYVKNGKKQKNIYSVTFANKGYILPKKSVFSYNNNGTNLISNLSFNINQSLSQYDAYIDFLLGNSVVLLGSQRDVFRINNREINGKIHDVLIEPVLTSSNLVQFMFLSRCEDLTKLEYTQKFVSMLTGESVQKLLNDYGMFSVLKNLKLSYHNQNLNIITTDDLSKLKIDNIFDDLQLN